MNYEKMVMQSLLSLETSGLQENCMNRIKT